MKKLEFESVSKGSDFIKYFKPIVEIIDELGGSAKPSEVIDAIFDRYDFSKDELEKKTQNGESIIRNRIRWARLYLAKGKVLDSTKRGVWILTPEYKKYFSKTESSYDFYIKVRKQFGKIGEKKKISECEAEIIEEMNDETSFKSKLLEKLMSISPKGFERLCQRLLRESGFSQVKVTGKSGDGGIDGYGVLETNLLLSSKVFFQAKRYKDSVSSDKIRDFKGALDGRTTKGIFITTGRFTKDAQEEANREGSTKIDLIDGERLIELFEKLELGLKPRTVYDIDYDFFKEFE